MATKIVRFARIKKVDTVNGISRHYAGHYPLPCILKNDVVKFISKTLDVTVWLGPEVRGKLLNASEELRVTPNESPELTAKDDIKCNYHFGASHIIPKAVDWEDRKPLNYLGEIDPCPPWPFR